MDVKKSLSFRIDETIEHFLLFVVRYFRTLFTIIKSPLSPEGILNNTESTPALFARPLSFLAIGAFAFSLLISVYPMGLMGMTDLIWFTDDIKEEIRHNWKQAISITSLVTVGMPVIFSVTGIASLSGFIFFTDARVRKKWFEANCYAFGFQSIMFLVVLSLDSILFSFVAIFRFLEYIPLTEDDLSSVLLLILITTVSVSYIWPLMFISSSFVQLKQFGHTGHLRKTWLTGGVYFFIMLYVYAGAASVLPYLDSKFFLKPEADITISDAVFLDYDKENEVLYLDLELIVNNVLSNDLLIDVKSSDYEFELQMSGEESEHIQDIATENLELNYPSTLSGVIRIEKNSYEILSMRLPMCNVKQFYCTVLKMENAIHMTDEAGIENSHLYLSVTANVVSSSTDLTTSQYVDIDSIYHLIAGSGEHGNDLCIDFETQ